MNDYWRDKRARLDQIQVPAYVLASYSTMLHLPGSLRGFEELPHDNKWCAPLQVMTVSGFADVDPGSEYIPLKNGMTSTSHTTTTSCSASLTDTRKGSKTTGRRLPRSGSLCWDTIL